MLNIQNLYSNPILIGVVLILSGAIEKIEKELFEDWATTPSGIAMIKNDLVMIVDDNAVNKAKTDREVMKIALVEELTPKIRKELETEITGKIKAEYDESIKADKNRITELENKIAEMSKPPESTGDENGSGAGTGDGVFVFDPENHHLEYRGNGYYVMDKEEKIHGPFEKDGEEYNKYMALVKPA